MKTRTISILATGKYLPKRVVDSVEIDEYLGKDPGWTKKKSGVIKRCFSDNEETTSYMAAEAAKKAINKSGLRISDIDCIISACGGY